MRYRLLAQVVLATVLVCSFAAAQDPFFGPDMGGGGMGGPSPGSAGPPSKKSKPKPPPGTPELHAASGASDDLVAPGSEPSLPAEPLKVSAATRARIGSDAAIDEHENGRTGRVEHNFYGPYYSEYSGRYSFKTLFPLWLERKQPSLTDPTKTDRASLFGGLYYNRRSAERADDILFPLFWNLTDKTSRTTIVGPLVNRVAPNETDNWLAPLYFIGTRKHGGYTILPPLLTYLNSGSKGGFDLIGPAFCSWRGGEHCSPKTAKDIDLGLFPLFFYGHTETSSYRLIPPLLHYHAEDERASTFTNVWGPVYRHHSEERDALHVFPFYYSLWGQDERHTTLLPFFHYGHKGNSSLFINPLYLTATGDHGEKTFVTWGFARYRGRTELDMWTPLYWQYRDPDIGLDQKLLFPLFYRRTSPRDNDIMVFPFGAHFERYGISETTWVTPVFRHSHDLRGWSTSINPILYVGRDGNDSYTVVAPFFWDFSSPSSRTTIGLPLYWRFAERDHLSQLIGNVYYAEKQTRHGLDWEIHIFPLFSYGQTPTGHWWNVLYGLAGYTRDGETTKVRTLWIPITVSGDKKQ